MKRDVRIYAVRTAAINSNNVAGINPISPVGLCVFIFLFTITFSIYGQTEIPKNPTFSSIQPVQPGKSYNTNTGSNIPTNGNVSPSSLYYTNSVLRQAKKQIPGYSISMGAHANDIKEQTYRIAEQASGTYINRPYLTAEQNKQRRIGYLLQQSENTKNTIQQHQVVLELINEVHTDEQAKRTNSSYYKSAGFIAKTKPYQDAMQNLEKQLNGQEKLSLSETYYQVENAYGNSYLSKDEYERILKQSVDFIRNYMRQQGMDINNNEAKNKAIQKFLNDKLTITVPQGEPQPGKKITHQPFFYDYEDFEGETDHRNFFITKCLATGAGQCNSLPAVYNILAEGIGAKCYLTFAPQHSFVKYPDATGQIHSYEPTSAWDISDRWYIEHMFINPQAIQHRIYLDTLNKKQIVANALLDLAFGYMKKYGAADGAFVRDCIRTAMKEFPKRNNIYTYLVYSSLLARQLERVLYENNIKDLKYIGTIPEASGLYQALLKNEETIKKLGYQEIPEQLYVQMMGIQECKGNKQKLEGISGKQKRDMFNISY